MKAVIAISPSTQPLSLENIKGRVDNVYNTNIIQTTIQEIRFHTLHTLLVDYIYNFLEKKRKFYNRIVV